jgi:predicted transcriptional regulator
MDTVKPPVTMKYLADIAGVNPGLVRKYVTTLRSLVGDVSSTPGGDGGDTG